MWCYVFTTAHFLFNRFSSIFYNKFVTRAPTGGHLKLEIMFLAHLFNVSALKSKATHLVVDHFLPECDLWPNNALYSSKGYLYQICWPYNISKQFDCWLTQDDPCMTLAKCDTLVRGSSYQIFWPKGIPKQFDPWLTPAALCMTFDFINALHLGQGFFLFNLVAIRHS